MVQNSIDPWYLEHLVCPVDQMPLTQRGRELVSAAGTAYPIVDGIPVMLRRDLPQTQWVADASLQAAADRLEDTWQLQTLGIRPKELAQLQDRIATRDHTAAIDPVVQYLQAATSGYAYIHLLGQLQEYPIPDTRLPDGQGRSMLDLGCSWGRWSVAAARTGYTVTGIDPSLGAILAARRVTRQLGLPNHYVVADARHLPFRPGSFDTVFSYSVLQHMADKDVEQVLRQTGRVLRDNGTALIQMAHALGIRSLQHQARRGFRAAKGFEVRYRSLAALQRMFTANIGPTEASVDCYFGLGLQKADSRFMPTHIRALIQTSESLRSMSLLLPALRYLADSLYLQATKR